MLYTYQYRDQTHTIRMERQPDGSYLADVNGRPIAVTIKKLHSGGWLLNVAGQRFTVYGTVEGRLRHLQVNGDSYTLTVPDSGTKRRRHAGGGSDLTAQMPGQIIDVLVNEGEEVKAGQTLVVLEAMKMEIRVTAPTDGRVRRLIASKGAVVERGQVLVEIESGT